VGVGLSTLLSINPPLAYQKLNVDRSTTSAVEPKQFATEQEVKEGEENCTLRYRQNCWKIDEVSMMYLDSARVAIMKISQRIDTTYTR
jgi:hypothetical protein